MLGDICPSMWSPAEAQLGILFCPSVYSYFYFTWNTGHLHCHFEMVKSLTTRCAVRTSTELPFTLPFGHVFWFTGIYSLCSPIAHSPTNSLFSTRNEPSSLSQPRLCEQRGYLTPGISLLWQTLWARTPPHPALNFHYAENKGGSTSPRVWPRMIHTDLPKYPIVLFLVSLCYRGLDIWRGSLLAFEHCVS